MQISVGDCFENVLRQDFECDTNLSPVTPTNYDSKQIEDSLVSPSIVHLAGGKPWNEYFGGIYRKLYWDYRLDTPWPAKPNWKFRLKNKYRIIYSFARFIGFVKHVISSSSMQTSITAISFHEEK